jgi:CMP-N-acetylneuraminic acid synthetase
MVHEKQPASEPGYRALGIIPARGGSKRIPRKNLYPLAGKPLLLHTVDAAKESRLLARTIVSTDDEEIRRVALDGCAEAPFLRPAEFASDLSPTIDAVLHALEYAEREEGKPYDIVCVLEPTAPLRTGADIDAALELFRPEVDSVIGLTPVAVTNPGRLRVIREGKVVRLSPENSEPVYVPGGGIFAARRGLLIGQRTLQGPRQAGYILPRERGLDIDTLDDVALAESLLPAAARKRP